MPIRLAAPTREAYDFPLLIHHILASPLRGQSDHEIVHRGRLRFRYGEFSERVSRLGSALRDRGVDAGTCVAVMDWDSHRYLECYFAVPMLGSILQTVNVRLTAEQILYTLRDTRAEVVIFHRDFLDVVEQIRGRLDRVRTFVLSDDVPDADDLPPFCAARYEELMRGGQPDFDFPEFDERAIATTFHTTGTTGMPKAVCFSHRQIVLHTLAMTAALSSPAYGQSFRHGDVYMPLTPMFHVHAWGAPYVATLLGVRQVYPGRYVPEEILALRASEQVTYSHCVPTILRMLLTAAKSSGADLRGWKMTIGGAALTPALAAEAVAAGIDVFAGYGMSETGPVLTINRLQGPPAAAPTAEELALRCKVGLPIPLVDLRIIGADSRLQPADGISQGEIVVRAPWTTPCYVGQDTASAELWAGGYLHTQDIGVRDPDGCLRITDRVKDVIKSGGEWISSLAIEAAILEMPGVLEAAVIARPDAKWGERPHAFVVPRVPKDPTVSEAHVLAGVIAASRIGRLPAYAVPDSVTIIDALPKTSVGKIDKRALRSLASQ